MRAFIVLALVAAASASVLPGGYQYGLAPGTFKTVSGTVVGPDVIVGAGNNVIGSSGGIYNTGATYNTGGVISPGGTSYIGLNALDAIPQTVEYSKQFYHFTAPEEYRNEGHIQQQLSNVLKKNLQVVFIKAPENNAATNAAIQVAKQAIEQKTAIYVLSKENDASHVVAQLQNIQENIQTPPDVRFIKYRTEQDIANAKNVIQSQYNIAGGYSENIDGGVAPVLDYASKVVNIGSPTVLTSGPLVGGSGLIGGGTIVGGGGLIGGGTVVSGGGLIGGGTVVGGGGLIGGGTVITNHGAGYLPPDVKK